MRERSDFAEGLMNNQQHRHSNWLAIAILVSFFPAGCLFFGHKKKTPVSMDANVAPDKMLYDRAVDDYKHGRYTEARLNLQTLINSYPDSEYLAKAKLAVADSYYKEGGIDSLTQAVQEYKDYITFFPFLDDASYAQMQVAMAHYRMMEKADRDPTEARLAEQEFQTFMLKYPKSPLYPQAEQRLRDVQEVLAQADFDVARFYYIKDDFRASIARLIEVTNRYPLFSQSDRAIWMMGDIYRRASAGSKNEQQRAFWRAQADNQYARLVKEYPLSSLANEAKNRLTSDGLKPPAPDPTALAQAEYDKKYAAKGPGMFHKALGILKSTPDVSRAARTGDPDLNPPGEATAPQEILSAASTTGGSSATGSNVSVQTVSPGDSTAPPSTSTGAPSAPPDSGDSTTPPAVGETRTPSSTGLPVAGVAYPPQDVTKPKANAAPAADPSAAGTQAADASGTAKSDSKKVNKKKESTSKKKKGLRKLIPW
jgi:outer membrane protein assembly factor BamD